MIKMMLICLLVCSIAQVLAVGTFKSIKTPNGGAYAGTFSSGDGSVNGGFGGGYSGSTGEGASGYGGGSSGGYGGSFGGGGGGYGSVGGGGGGYGASAGIGGVPTGPFPLPFGPFPSFESFVNPAEFNKVLGSYFEDLQKNYASGVSMTYASPDATAYASSSLSPSYSSNNLYQRQLQSQSQIFNNIREQVLKAQSGTGGGYAPNHASASASYGPNGIHQTASVYPPNPNSPNVDTRFASENDINSGKPQFYGISTSSFAESSNINGVEQSRKGAVTTVNDNGKVTTYKSGS